MKTSREAFDAIKTEMINAKHFGCVTVIFIITDMIDKLYSGELT